MQLQHSCTANTYAAGTSICDCHTVCINCCNSTNQLILWKQTLAGLSQLMQLQVNTVAHGVHYKHTQQVACNRKRHMKHICLCIKCHCGSNYPQPAALTVHMAAFRANSSHNC